MNSVTATTARPPTRELVQRRCRSISIAKVSLVVALLAIHFAARWHRARSMPLADRHNYEQTYAYGLSLLAGRGFHNLPVPPTPEGEPIARFLAKESDQVTPEQFQALIDNPGPQDFDADSGEHNYWASSRILDQYVVAGLWRLFGIRWQVLFLFAVAMSTLSCLFVFFIGRRIGGNYWAGLIAAMLYFASPLAGYLETWSLRDASPLWFATAGFCFLFCVVDPLLADRVRPQSPAKRLGACAALGLLAMFGVGWRPDVLLLVLYLGFALLAISWRRGLSWSRILSGVAIYGLGAICCHAAIFSLSSERELDAQNGFQNTVYADFSRANLLEIENSFQIQRCDRATLFLARQFDRSHHPDAPPLAYKGHGFSQICRSMFFDELRYNAYRLVSQFPRVYWKALGGLMVPGAFETQDTRQLREGRLPWLSPLYRVILDPISAALPWFFLLGLFAAVAIGAMGPQALLLGGLTVIQSLALLLVLPEQKHCGVLLLPMTVLGGVGTWTLLRLTRRANWTPVLTTLRSNRPRVWLAAAATTACAWGLALLVSHQLSVHERQHLIEAIQAAARTSVPAPETLHGDKVLSVSRLPGSSPDSTGYLLKISAGADPGDIHCRHVHFPQDWCWPRVLETVHLLKPNREQYFFVTCEQGSEYGDPRPYCCTVRLNGDARIESCSRVDLSRWDRLPVSTVFYDGQSSPGAPRSLENNSVMRWPNWPAIRSLSEDWRVMQAYARKSLFVGPQPVQSPSRPIEHLAARDISDGNWRIAISDGRKFQPAALSYWSPKAWTWLVSGDFDGDGMADLLGRATDGSWWLGLANGNSIAFKPCSLGLPDLKIDYVGVGDFNGDGIDDLAIRSSDGQWWIGLSDGIRFSFRRWTDWPANIQAQNIRIGDFNGDGRADIAGLDAKSGDWLVSQSDGTRFVTRVWGNLGPAVEWQHVLAADFSGHGRTDVAAWNPTTGEWKLGQSDGKRFNCEGAGNWPVDAEWQHVTTGHFSDDRRQGIVGLDKKSERIAIAILDTSTAEAPRFTTQYFASHAALDGGIYIGGFNGDTRDNLAGWTKSGEIWVGVLDGSSLRFEHWGNWPQAAHLSDACVLSFWRRP